MNTTKAAAPASRDPVLPLADRRRELDRKIADRDRAEKGTPEKWVGRLLRIERTMAVTPSTTLAGVIAKLEAALLCYEHEDRTEMAAEHLLAVTALEDLRKIAAKPARSRAGGRS